MDGGLTWTARNIFVPLERQEWQQWDGSEVREPSGAYFKVDRDNPHIIRRYEGSSDREVVYSYEYLLSGGNRWMQALDKRDVENRVIATGRSTSSTMTEAATSLWLWAFKVWS